MDVVEINVRASNIQILNIISSDQMEHIISFDQIKNMNMLHMKKCQSLNKMTQKTFRWMWYNFGIFSSEALLDFCSGQLILYLVI